MAKESQNLLNPISNLPDYLYNLFIVYSMPQLQCPSHLISWGKFSTFARLFLHVPSFSLHRPSSS